ncbi:hypothetical protein KAU09_03205 [Candidatus Parcubacteria bacterium]|nr:hypothetical protein [Candidatus Parcubacteria bacterium]
MLADLYKNKKGTAYLGLIIGTLFVVGIVIGGFYFTNNYNANPRINANIANSNDVNSIIDVLNEAKDDIGDINDATDIRDNKVDEILEKPNDLVADNSDIKEWDVLERENEGFSIKYPHGWYYTVNRKEAVEMGYDMIIGFEFSEAVWDKKPHYSIELIIADKNKKWLPYDGVSVDLGIKDGKKLILQSPNENKKIVDKMSESFKIIK